MSTLADQLGIDRLPSARQRERSLSELISLRGRTALVTAGAGTSLGSVIVERLASLGANVAVVDIDHRRARETACAMEDRHEVRAIGLRGDVTDADDVQRFVDEAIVALGPLDVVVNNAGGSKFRGRRSGPFLSEPVAWLDEVVRFNLLGTMYVARAVVPSMIERGGKLIFVSSEAGKVAMRNAAAYSGAKAGVIGFTRALAREVGPHGITVNAVCPGMMLNDLVIDGLRQLPADATTGHTDTYRRISLERPCHPEEVANMVALLATDAASYVHGTSLSVSGGMSD